MERACQQFTRDNDKRKSFFAHKKVQLATDNRSAAGKGLFGGKTPEQSFAVEHSFGKGN